MRVAWKGRGPTVSFMKGPVHTYVHPGPSPHLNPLQTWLGSQVPREGSSLHGHDSHGGAIQLWDVAKAHPDDPEVDATVAIQHLPATEP